MPSPNILLVEDDRALLRIFLEELTFVGFAPVGVASGEEASALLDREHFDLLVTDINLSGRVSGISLLGKCIADHRKTKVIVITGMVGLADAPVGRSGFPGANLTLFKPFDYGDLTHAINSILAD